MEELSSLAYRYLWTSFAVLPICVAAIIFHYRSEGTTNDSFDDEICSHSELIRPNDDDESTAVVDEALAFGDQLSFNIYIPILLRFESLLDSDVLKQGLQKALNLYPMVAGRLNQSTNVYRIQGTEGVLFQLRNADEPAPMAKDSLRVWTNAKLIPDKIFNNGNVSIKATTPLCFIRVNYFQKEGITILGVLLNHALGDATAAYNFVKTWSVYCDDLKSATTKNNTDLPIIKPQPQGQRNLSPKVIFHPLKTWQFWFINKLIFCLNMIAYLIRAWCLSTMVEVEFIVSLDEISKLKRRISGELTQVPWVSSYEVVMGSAAAAYAYATKRKSLNLPVTINLRGRTSFHKQNYFGNALAVEIQTNPTMRIDDYGQKGMVSLIEQLHVWVRSQVELGDAMIRAEPDFSNIREAGVTNVSYLMTFVAVRSGALLNDWTGDPWFSLSMGSGQKPSAMDGVSGNCAVIMLSPHTPKTHRLFLPVYRSQIPRLLEYIRLHDLPFELRQK